MAEVELPLENWSGKVEEVTLGGNGRKSTTIGGETTLPFLHFEGEIPNRPVVSFEVHDRPPSDWSSPLLSAWGDAINDPATWAKKAVEYGADLLTFHLKSAHPEDMDTGPEEAAANVTKVLEAVNVPLMIIGPYVAEKDNEVLVAAADAAAGQRVALGYCEEGNYRTIAAACIANNHVAISKTPIEINLAKQLNILITDMGVAPNAIIMDPTTAALGYGLEYVYSVMERLRLAALQGDSMTQKPMSISPGEEAWRQKEAKFAEGVPETWGKIEDRALAWEQFTATALLHSGADIITLRHPKSAETIHTIIDQLMAGAKVE
jgi:acetyl-CoA decarbonylase/synthase complex subunit delta